MFIERPPWFYRKLFPGSVWRLPAEEPCVYITFDDGPNAATTPRLLRLLDQLAVPATFFCVGDNVRRYPKPTAPSSPPDTPSAITPITTSAASVCPRRTTWPTSAWPPS